MRGYLFCYLSHTFYCRMAAHLVYIFKFDALDSIMTAYFLH